VAARADREQADDATAQAITRMDDLERQLPELRAATAQDRQVRASAEADIKQARDSAQHEISSARDEAARIRAPGSVHRDAISGADPLRARKDGKSRSFTVTHGQRRTTTHLRKRR
jgi:hypothetical protein